jgi:hypothetical protein
MRDTGRIQHILFGLAEQRRVLQSFIEFFSNVAMTQGRIRVYSIGMRCGVVRKV